MARNYQQLDLKRLFGKSAFYCAFPQCMTRLLAPATPTDEEKVLGQIAHIVASSDDGPRGDPSFDPKLRDRYENLVILCAHHHTVVDSQDSTYTKEQLRSWKGVLETWVEERTTESMSRMSFAELEVICNSLVSPALKLGSTAMVSIPPNEKIEFNDLEDCRPLFNQGFMQASLVGEYIDRYTSTFDSHFPKRLRAGFVTHYETLRSDGLKGSALFHGMLQFAADSASPVDASLDQRFLLRCAALAVLCHLFELCDVFEVPKSA